MEVQRDAAEQLVRFDGVYQNHFYGISFVWQSKKRILELELQLLEVRLFCITRMWHRLSGERCRPDASCCLITCCEGGE